MRRVLAGHQVTTILGVLFRTDRQKDNMLAQVERLNAPSAKTIDTTKPHFATLSSRPVTEEAKLLIERLADVLLEHEAKHLPPKTGKTRNNKRGPKRAADFRHALGAFLADLLKAYTKQAADGWVFRSLQKQSFTGQAISYHTFKAIHEAMRSYGLIEHIPGKPLGSSNAFNPGQFIKNGGQASHFRATQVLLDTAEGLGVTPETVGAHFLQDLPRKPLVLKASSTKKNGQKISGRQISFKTTPVTQQLEADVRQLNQFLDRFDLRGGTHRGYRRIFNEGDRENYGWDKGGRLYSQGDDSYQRLKKEKRLEMTIDGEPVVEIDITASYLTIYHALKGQPFDASSDPYAFQGYDRGLVKLWAIATFGNNEHLKRWPKDLSRDYKKNKGHTPGEKHPVKAIRALFEDQYPVLREWGQDGITWADLMFIESRAMVGSMLELMEKHGRPSFGVHDSLIVAQRDLELACEVLKWHYKASCSIEPSLKISEPKGSSESLFKDEIVTKYESNK